MAAWIPPLPPTPACLETAREQEQYVREWQQYARELFEHHPDLTAEDIGARYRSLWESMVPSPACPAHPDGLREAEQQEYEERWPRFLRHTMCSTGGRRTIENIALEHRNNYIENPTSGLRPVSPK